MEYGIYEIVCIEGSGLGLDTEANHVIPILKRQLTEHALFDDLGEAEEFAKQLGEGYRADTT